MYTATEQKYRKQAAGECIARSYEGSSIIGIFNFSEYEKAVHIEAEGTYTDLLTGEKVNPKAASLSAYGFYYLKRA